THSNTGKRVGIERKGSGGVAVRIVDTDESRRAKAVDEEVDVEGRRLSLSDVEAGTDGLAHRLPGPADRCRLHHARDRMESMRASQQEPGFWADQPAALAAFDRYN